MVKPGWYDKEAEKHLSDLSGWKKKEFVFGQVHFQGNPREISLALHSSVLLQFLKSVKSTGLYPFYLQSISNKLWSFVCVFLPRNLGSARCLEKQSQKFIPALQWDTTVVVRPNFSVRCPKARNLGTSGLCRVGNKGHQSKEQKGNGELEKEQLWITCWLRKWWARPKWTPLPLIPSCMRLGSKHLFLTILINLCPKCFVNKYICGWALLLTSSPPASASSSQSIPWCSPIKYVPLSPPRSHFGTAELPRRQFSICLGRQSGVCVRVGTKSQGALS